jgi:predicted Zn-dependent protease
MPGDMNRWLVLLVLASCAAAPSAELAPGENPAPGSTEANLWMVMDRVETQLQASGQVVRNPALDVYLVEIVCRLEPEHCRNVRIYVVDVPHFNASMAPNGVMQVWTGLLLRTENEAQLAFVLSHELAHYVRRHSLQRWIDVQNKANAASIFGLVTSAAGIGYAGDIGALAALASILAFSRDQEREADAFGLQRAVEAGYDPHEGARIWRALRAEQAASETRERFVFLSTHPGVDERIRTLEAAARAIPDAADRTIATGRLAAVTAPYLDEWLGDELTRGAPGESEVLLDRLLERQREPSLIQFYRGELYRRRGAPGDLDRAVGAYEAAIATDPTAARANRGLGQVLIRQGDDARARAALARYVELAPDAPDRLMIEEQIKRLR